LIGERFAAQTSFTNIETRLFSSGQKNMLVITGAVISSLTERTLPCPKAHLQNALRKRGYSQLLWMGGCSGNVFRGQTTSTAGAQLRGVLGEELNAAIGVTGDHGASRRVPGPYDYLCPLRRSRTTMDRVGTSLGKSSQERKLGQ